VIGIKPDKQEKHREGSKQENLLGQTG